MNAIDKLRSLQAGELDKVLPDIYVGTPWSKTLYPICKINAAKVEVTKVMLDEYLRTGDKTILQQLKEIL
jgi:hypothetical protein